MSGGQAQRRGADRAKDKAARRKIRKIQVEREFEQLVDRYSQQVLSTAYGVLGNRDSAMDVHQEVFLAVWKRWQTYTGDENWNGYLYRTTVRKALEHAKRSRKEKSLDPVTENTQEQRTDDGPEARMAAGELVGRLRECLGRLPEQQAQAFILARIKGLEYAQVASAIGCSEGTARVHLHRALKRLAHEMRDCLEQGVL